MKLNKIIFFFCLSLPICVGLRILQLLFTVDYVTGFYYIGKETTGNAILILILLAALFTGVFSRLVFYRPENPPKANLFTAIFSLALCGGIYFEAFIQPPAITLAVWQAFLLQSTSVLACIYFLCFALSFVIKFRIPKILANLPVIYLIVKLICDFTVISKLALISDNIIMIAAYCTTLLFFLNFTKLYNEVDKEICFKKLLSLGLPSVVLSFTSAIPHIFINLKADNIYLHTSVYSNLTLLLFGIFILGFLISYFFQKNKN